MFIPRFSLKWRKLRSLLEVTTNILVVLVVLGAVAIIARNYFASRRTESPSKIQVGTIFPAIPQIRVNQSRKTLILALSVHCRFCIQSIPLYHRLAEAARENKDSFSIVAIFLDKESELVSKFAEEHKLAILAIPTVDFASAKIAKTPTLVLVDNNSKVLESWVGQLPEDQEKDVFEALGVPYRERLEPLTTIASKDPDVEKTVDVFDENNALLRIEPQTTKEDLQKRFVTAFEVDSKGNVYLIDLNSLLIYDVQGGLIASIPLPDDFTSPFCIDDHGQIYAQGKSGLSVYSSSLVKIRDLPLDGVISEDSTLLKLAFDRGRDQLYVQVYDESPLSQKLYKVNPETLRVTEVYKLKDPVPFNPSYSLGAFDFTLGSQYVYVSDIREYKLFLFSLRNSSLVKTFTRPYIRSSVRKEDAILPVRHITIGGLGETLREYPPIFHLNFTNRNKLLVWTSRRDRTNRQVVDVYDQHMNFLGVDKKYMHPQTNNYVFANNRVYAPDFAFGVEVKVDSLSPLEVPSRPIALKVFAE